MNLQWFASAEWALIVKALTHTLWQGTVLAVGLGILLRRCQTPLTRYRCALAALAGVLAAGVLTWAWLNRPEPRPIAGQSAPARPMVPAPAVEPAGPVMVVNVEPSKPVNDRLGWTAWGALLWLAGATLMIGRAGFQVAGAERLRRSSHPLEDSRIVELLKEARNAVGLVRNVRMAVTDKLTSPAVVGVWVSTLILPLSLVSTLSHEQIRFILLHELAHIRRGDYFANLFQLFVEALLFFNPAVWWISRQVRLEREACCDALAIELSGAPADYARTLVHVAENVLQPSPAAAPAFGDQREPSSLADRVQRLLVPGYRPRLRLTWRAMVAALCVSGGLLTLSAIGTRVTMAAILSPEQRIERIEKKMTELGGSIKTYSEVEKMPPVSLSGHIRMAEGTAIPKWTWVYLNSVVQNSSSGTATSARDGQFKCEIRPGNLYLSAELTNYAPAFIGPLDGFSTNRFENLELIFSTGFQARIELTDAVSGQPIANGKLTARFSLRGNSGSAFHNHELLTDESGMAVLDHAADLPLTIAVNVPGYDILDQRFETVSSNTPLRIKLQPGAKVAGAVTDKMSGKPIDWATVQIRYERGPLERGYGWDDASRVIAITDANGRFESSQLRKDTVYWLGITAPGHESIVLSNVRAGQLSLKAELGPQIVVKGRITGQLDRLENAWGGKGGKALAYTVEDRTTENRCDYGERADVRIVDGVGYFEFTNRYAANVVLHVPGQSESRYVAGPVDDWLVNLTNAVKTEAKDLPKREVVFRFQSPSGVMPRGAVSVMIPDDLDPKHRTAHIQQSEINNGEVRVSIAIGGNTSIEPKRMIGFTFNRTGNWRSPTGESGDWLSIQVRSNTAPLVIEIPLIPAGAIYARARNADGTPAGGLFFGVSELKRAPGRDQNSLDSDGDSFSDSSPRRWVSGPLPLGGTYQIHAWRGNSFCVSQPVKLTEANPDADVELQFPHGQKFAGELLDQTGKPVRDAELKVSFSLSNNHGFGLKPVFTDGQGRFELADLTPGMGEYSVEIDQPGMMAVQVKLDFARQPQVIRLNPGRVLGGQVVDAATGWPIPGMEVRALDFESNKLPMQRTQTDDDGRFQFNTLGDGNYTLYPDGGELLNRPSNGNLKFRADGRTNLVLRVKLYEWSNLKPKAPAEEKMSRTNGPAGTNFGNAATGAMPTVGTVTGLLADPNFRVVIHALEQRSGTETLAEPEVVTTSGRGQNRIVMNNVVMGRPVADLVEDVKIGGFLSESNQALDTLLAAGPSVVPELTRFLLLGEPSYHSSMN